MKKLTIFALALSLIASCSKDDSVSISNSNVVSFSAGAITRVSSNSDGDDEWEYEDAIGVFSVGFDGVNDATDYNNVKYVSDITSEAKAAETTGFTSTTPILFPNTEEATVTFYAYYPYTAAKMYTLLGIMYEAYKMDVSEQGDDYGSVDFMTASATVTGYGVGKDVNDDDVAFLFKHKLAKVVLTITKQDNLKNIDGLVTKFNNVYCYKYYDYKGSEITNIYNDANFDEDSATGSFTVNSTPTTVTAILHPMGASDCPNAYIEFTITEDKDSPTVTRTCKVDFSGIALTAGSVHPFTIALGNDEPVLTGSAIEDWGNNVDSAPLYSTEEE